MTALNTPVVLPLAAVHTELAAEIHRTCFAESWAAEVIGSLLATPGTEGFLAVTNSLPIGMILFRAAADEVELLTLAVLPAARRAGSGSALVGAMLCRARECGARAVYLEVAEDNIAAKGLYGSFGFESVGRRPGYYRTGTGRATAEIFKVDLTSRADRGTTTPSE